MYINYVYIYIYIYIYVYIYIDILKRNIVSKVASPPQLYVRGYTEGFRQF